MIPSPEGKRSMMKLAQRMVTNFCTSISASNGHRWTTLSGLNEVGVRVTIHKSSDPGQPNGVVLSAATTIWLPVPPHTVFNFFKDERKRPQVKYICIYIFICYAGLSSISIYVVKLISSDLQFFVFSVGCSFQW